MKGTKGSKLWELQQKANNGGGDCEKCKRRTDYLTIDHIIPISYIIQFGLKIESQEHDWNMQLLCRPCNKLKGGMLDYTDSRTFPNLRRYVDLAEQFYKV